MRFRLILLCCVLSATICSAQRELVQTLKDDGKIETSYHLYPSTLRMINLDRDPSFDELIRPLRKLSIYSLRKDSLEKGELNDSFNSLMTNGYEEYIQVEGDSISVLVIGNERKGKTSILANTEEDCYMVNMEGMINILKLTDVWESYENRDTSSVGFGMLVDYITNDKNEKREREERRRKREEEREKDALENKDSFQITIGDEASAIEPEDSSKIVPSKSEIKEN